MKYLTLPSYLCVVTVFCLLVACKSTSLKIGNFDVGKLVNQGVKVFNASNIDEAQEIQFGENMSAVLLGARPLYENKEINVYVNKVGMWLASNSSRPDLSWQFGVINSTAINAFAAPGGFVFITSGMLMQLENEAQLAAVLAHEISHITEQHHLNAIKEEANRSAITESLFISAQAYQDNTSANDEDKNYGIWAKKVTGMAQNLYAKGLGRDDELQADQLGIRLLAKSGYDAFAYIDNLQVLASIDADDSALALLYQTHPAPSQRLAALAEQLDKLAMNQGLLLTKRFISQMN
ncbi:peptidase M48 [Colwellia sp. 75C3]|uniref:M48 family metalloprotease n=1 Tax=Colwellia sp. 75C3 TaxID=888425 RepID=UPI000C335E00|nr:M48 family metalloprotease [Colwellia sp. 75C3]PKG82173.1 peptidase M48 [Colwellia sp. 75C3]